MIKFIDVIDSTGQTCLISLDDISYIRPDRDGETLHIILRTPHVEGINVLGSVTDMRRFLQKCELMALGETP